jgi:PPK2 family polyphosphate:nucleotide phosphotransferase
MLLTPIKRSAVPGLTDADARAPKKGVPNADELPDATAALLARAATLHSALYAERKRALLVVLQGRDASGKDGIVRKVFSALHPAGLHMRSFGVPAGVETQHHYLWRIQLAVPPFGSIGVWNRSHYEDILVPRVHGTLPKRIWTRRYDEINEFESETVALGTRIIKLFVHVSHDEQRIRLQERAADPNKGWKVKSGDLRDRARWPEFTRAFRDIFRETSTKAAPWYLLPADKKPVRDYLVAKLLVDVLSDMDPVAPPIDPELKRAFARLR